MSDVGIIVGLGVLGVFLLFSVPFHPRTDFQYCYRQYNDPREDCFNKLKELTQQGYNAK